MKNMKWLLLVIVLFVGCTDERPEVVTKKGVITELYNTSNAWSGTRFYHVIRFEDGSTGTVVNSVVVFTVHDTIECSMLDWKWKYANIDRSDCKLTHP